LAISGLVAKEQSQKDQVPGVAPQPAEFFYTGKPYDTDLGAYAFNYRNYDPELKRWTTMDPSGFPDGVNNSLYVSNSPLGVYDTDGLMSVSISGVTIDLKESGVKVTVDIPGSGVQNKTSSNNDVTWTITGAATLKADAIVAGATGTATASEAIKATIKPNYTDYLSITAWYVVGKGFDYTINTNERE
jgi:RHS repeat-associated protein